MVIEIKKSYSKKKRQALIKKAFELMAAEEAKKPKLRDFFGSEPQKEDPLKYQKRIRREWD